MTPTGPPYDSADLPPHLVGTRVLLVTGKGGVGKTTVAAATAVRAARRGTKTLLVSTDPAHSVADVLLGPAGPVDAVGQSVGADPVEIETGLSVQHVDARARGRQAWGTVRGYLTGLGEAVGLDPLEADDLTVLPGVEDVLALLEVRDQVRAGRYDLVVVDCAATAETLRLLAVPEALGRYLDRSLPIERRLARALRPAMARARPGALPVPGPDVVAAADRLIDELAGVREMLTGPGTSVRVVTTPEHVAVAEARRSITWLALHGHPVEALVVNRVVPAVGSGDDGGLAAGLLVQWRAAQQEVLTAVIAELPGTVVRTVAWQPREPRGADDLAALPVDGDDLETIRPASDPTVERDGDDLVLLMPLPLARRDDIDLARRGDDLVVAVGQIRRLVALPSALRRCTVAGAGLTDGMLRVRFRPDPSQWRPL